MSLAARAARTAAGLMRIATSPYHGVMRTTLTLDPDVFEAAQSLARASGKRLGQVVSELARRGLRARPGAAASSGVPVFSVPPDAPIIPADRARDLLAGEPR
jgi:hypothetical protein